MKNNTEQDFPRRLAELEDALRQKEAVEESLRKTEQALRQANMQLSAALAEIKRSHLKMIQYERLVALCQMARSIAHELNNILMPILGFSDLLLQNPETLSNRAETVNILADIRTAAQEAAAVIRRLREFYRASDDPQTLTTLEVNALIESMLDLTQSQWSELQAKGTAIRVERRLEDVPPIRGVESQLREALMHLTLNALDAMPQGGVLSFRTRVDGDWVVLEIADTGVGMTEEVRRRCFEPFFTTKGPEATGMGLAVVYGIVRRHGGSVEIESAPGTGTCVHIRLPRSERAPETAPSPPHVALPLLRVLVIDDDPWSCNVNRGYLHAEGHTVEVAESGAEGLDRFRAGSFDLVIVDRAMPDMSGDQVTQTIQAERPGTPVIMLTGFGEIMRESGEHPPGVALVLSKPLTGQELLSGISRVLGKHPASPCSGPAAT